MQNGIAGYDHNHYVKEIKKITLNGDIYLSLKPQH